MALVAGLTGKADLTVSDADTARAMRSGDVAVLATPRLVALAEEAAVAAVAGELGIGETTVGSNIQLDHVAPTPVGGHVVAEATLAGCQGRRLEFTFRIHDDRGLVAAGRHTRAVVDRERFLDHASGGGS
jgi:predicted thioesterase